MELIYITHHNLANLNAFAPALSWWIVIGAVYGGVCLVRDTLWFLARIAGVRRE